MSPAAPPAAPAPTVEAAKRLTALKIAGLVTFVAGSCPQLKPDYARFKLIIEALGLTEKALDAPENKNGYLSYAAAYQKDSKASCERAGVLFGLGGRTIPNLFTRQ